MPTAGDRAGIINEQRDIERTDVDAEFERVGRYDGADRSLPQSLLDGAAAVWQIAAAIAADSLRCSRFRVELFLQVGGEDLCGEPALREDDQLQVALEKLRGDATGLAKVRAPDPELMIDDRRIDEDEELLPARRASENTANCYITRMLLPPFPKRLLGPKWWPTWLGLGLMWLIARLPYCGQLAFGRFLGVFTRRLPGSRRRIARPEGP